MPSARGTRIGTLPILCGIAAAMVLTSSCESDRTLAPTVESGGRRVGDPVPGRLIVRARDAAGFEAYARAAGIEIEASIPRQRVFAVRLDASDGDGPSLASLVSSSSVQSVASDSWVHVNSRVEMEYDADLTEEDFGNTWAFNKIKRLAALAYATGDGVIVGVLDTGVKSSLSCFSGKLVPGWDFVGNDSIPEETANTVNEDADSKTDEGAGHGTLMAGLIVYVAPDAQVLPCRIFDDEGWGTLFECAAAVEWAVDHGADVLSLSASSVMDSTVLEDALDYATSEGVLLVCAAGNDDTDDSYYPAAYADAFGVGGSNTQDLITWDSNYGAGNVDILAPGIDVSGPWWLGGFAWADGTSPAAAITAAVAALYLELDPGATPAEVADALRDGSDAVTPTNPPFSAGDWGAGRLNAEGTVLLAP